MKVGICQAKANFSSLLSRVAAGEEIVITRFGVPMARLVAAQPEEKKLRPLGMERGRMWVADDFDAPLPDGLLKAFYGGKLPKLDKKRSTRK